MKWNSTFINTIFLVSADTFATSASLAYLARASFYMFIMDISCRLVWIHVKLLISVREELTPHPDIRESSYFQSDELRNRVKNTTVYGRLIFQPREGYCGHASVLNVIASISSTEADDIDTLTGKVSEFLVPALPSNLENSTPLSVSRPLTRIYGNEAVEIFEAPFSYDAFREHIVKSGGSEFRYMMSFLRAPAFANDPQKQSDSFVKRNLANQGKLFSGHFSLVEGLIASDDRPGRELVVVHDVNKKYGTTFYPIEVLFRAVNTMDVINDSGRGFVRVRL